MRVEQVFTVRRPPGEVFAYMTDPANLAAWQTSKVSVEPLTDGPPRQGYRIKERTKVGLRQWDQVVEFTEFEPGRAFFDAHRRGSDAGRRPLDVRGRRRGRHASALRRRGPGDRADAAAGAAPPARRRPQLPPLPRA